ncbi:RHS repeat-associated core domain-containing protein [Streptomyces mirabilis]|uniref:RHS repeat-associated core domain-containing protein n=1 Tax=Streptomyces mirabilis TaxID=68239 RepID=UPI003F4CF8E2
MLYLDDGTEVHLDTSTSTAKYWAQRYYTTGASTIALRTNKTGTNNLTWLTADQHGTSTLTVDATTQAVTKRYTTPFGAPRSGGTGTWPDDKTFLGDSTDPTSSITYIGAREYDLNSGRFISVDPVLDTSDSQSRNGYTYADNNPVTDSDPTGRWLDDGTGHNEPRKGGPAGPSSPTPGVPTGGTGPGGCLYTCGSNGTASTSSTGKTSSGHKSGGSKWGWLSNAVNTVVDYGSAIFSQPDIWWGAAETGGSMALMGLGADTTATGIGLCLTGVGCLAGVPIAAGGVGMIGARAPEPGRRRPSEGGRRRPLSEGWSRQMLWS